MLPVGPMQRRGKLKAPPYDKIQIVLKSELQALLSANEKPRAISPGL